MTAISELYANLSLPPAYQPPITDNIISVFHDEDGPQVLGEMAVKAGRSWCGLEGEPRIFGTRLTNAACLLACDGSPENRQLGEDLVTGILSEITFWNAEKRKKTASRF